jgi:hypothetical protein
MDDYNYQHDKGKRHMGHMPVFEKSLHLLQASNPSVQFNFLPYKFQDGIPVPFRKVTPA